MADISSIVLAIKAIWDTIKGTRNLKKIPEVLMDGEARKDFLNNNPNATIVYVQKGDCYIGDKSQLNDKDKLKLNKIYNPISNNEVEFDIIDTDFFNRIQDFKKELPNSKNINPFLKFLDYDLKAILNLSIYSKKLFDNKESERAQKVREDIGKHYGKEGRKLCNLYLSGYIDGMTEFLIQEYGQNTEKIRVEINEKIRSFVKESDYIFFIHSASDEEDILSEVRRCIHENKQYIAIHGAGSINIKKVRDIIKKLEKELSDSNYDINEESKRTLSLCPLLYVYLTKKKN
ncbi:hypothetical protein HYW76_01665 [Candidatus Pacearchaeota archaeon]|nr:hypothetical protein [Candidatus Pacearchaeota archaeon]